MIDKGSTQSYPPLCYVSSSVGGSLKVLYRPLNLGCAAVSSQTFSHGVRSLSVHAHILLTTHQKTNDDLDREGQSIQLPVERYWVRFPSAHSLPVRILVPDPLPLPAT